MRNQPEPNQSQPKKPEWFELLDGDAPSAQVIKINKKLPVIAALVAGAVIASGALFSGASAESSTGQSAVASIGQSSNSPTPTSSSSTSAAVANSLAKDPAVGIQAPGSNVGEDGDDERHERGEGRDRDHEDVADEDDD